MSDSPTAAPAANDEAEFRYVLDDRSVCFDLDSELYPIDAIYGASYLFVDRCWLYFTRPSEATVRARLRAKEASVSEEQLQALAGEFANELLNQVVRKQVGEATAAIREYTLARAFFGTTQQSNIDALLAELDAEELDEDPLEIQVPWADGGDAQERDDG